MNVSAALFDGIVSLLNPLVEIVVHDLDSGKICYINGKISNRKIGSDSLLNRNEIEVDLQKVIYPKLNFDGRLVKSISIRLDDNHIACINCDISIFSQMENICHQLSAVNSNAQPEGLFKNDWQEKIHVAIHSFIKEREWKFSNLTGSQKKTVAEHLFSLGAFNEKKAADYIASSLKIGRATIFNYLREWRI
ncbi:MAG: hypothetical protein GY756_05980 [bacterium]|nr:hypothetical protein [bacterium]